MWLVCQTITLVGRNLTIPVRRETRSALKLLLTKGCFSPSISILQRYFSSIEVDPSLLKAYHTNWFGFWGFIVVTALCFFLVSFTHKGLSPLQKSTT